MGLISLLGTIGVVDVTGEKLTRLADVVSDGTLMGLV